MASSIPIYGIVKQEFTPGVTDDGEFEVAITAREGTSLPAMDEVMQLAETEVMKVPWVRTVIGGVGGGGGISGGPNQGRLYVLLKPHSERVFSISRLFSTRPWLAFEGNASQREIMQDIRQRLRKLPDVRVSLRGGQGSISAGGPSFEIDFALLGPDLETLLGFAEKLRARSTELGLVDADTSLRLDKPELRVEIDRARAADLGVQTTDIATTVLARAGLATANGMHGRSLLPVIEGTAQEVREALLVEEESQRADFGMDRRVRMRTLRDHRHRLTFYDGQAWGELYDLQADPMQLRNLWNDPGAQALRGELMERLARAMLDAADTSPYPTASA
jgi:multidrug efflux pump subunit AcrB